MFQAHLPTTLLERIATAPWAGYTLAGFDRLGPRRGALGPWHPDVNLDNFYIAARRGLDYETSEIVDLPRYLAADREDLAYGLYHPDFASSR